MAVIERLGLCTTSAAKSFKESSLPEAYLEKKVSVFDIKDAFAVKHFWEASSSGLLSHLQDVQCPASTATGGAAGVPTAGMSCCSCLAEELQSKCKSSIEAFSQGGPVKPGN